MAHFKLKSVDIAGMFEAEPGTYEYICAKNPGEKKYKRLSGPMGGFDVFNLKCISKEDYKRAHWIIDQLNNKYRTKFYPEVTGLSAEITNLYGSYTKVTNIIREIKKDKKENYKNGIGTLG
jgi:hypothetical protein